VYTATLGRQSGPIAGYNSLDGIYIEYANSFPVGEVRNDYRVRYGTLSGLSAEDILSERIADHVWGLHLGRHELLDINGVLVGVDQFTVNLDYDRQRIPGAPLDIQFAASAGSYGEIATGVATTRAEGILTLATDTFWLSPSVAFSAGGRARIDGYGTGQQRGVFELSGAIWDILTPRDSAAMSYSGVSIIGSTPFSFDLYTPGSTVSVSYSHVFGGFVQSASAYLTYDFLAMQTSMGLTLSMNLSPTTQFSVSGYYNLTTKQLTEVDYAVNVQCDCVSIQVAYRTFPQGTQGNGFFFTVGLNAF
jgi:hypothetical protein